MPGTYRSTAVAAPPSTLRRNGAPAAAVPDRRPRPHARRCRLQFGRTAQIYCCSPCYVSRQPSPRRRCVCTDKFGANETRPTSWAVPTPVSPRPVPLCSPCGFPSSGLWRTAVVSAVRVRVLRFQAVRRRARRARCRIARLPSPWPVRPSSGPRSRNDCPTSADMTSRESSAIRDDLGRFLRGAARTLARNVSLVNRALNTQAVLARPCRRSWYAAHGVTTGGGRCRATARCAPTERRPPSVRPPSPNHGADVRLYHPTGLWSLCVAAAKSRCQGHSGTLCFPTAVRPVCLTSRSLPLHSVLHAHARRPAPWTSSDVDPTPSPSSGGADVDGTAAPPPAHVGGRTLERGESARLSSSRTPDVEDAGTRGCISLRQLSGAPSCAPWDDAGWRRMARSAACVASCWRRARRRMQPPCPALLCLPLPCPHRPRARSWTQRHACSLVSGSDVRAALWACRVCRWDCVFRPCARVHCAPCASCTSASRRTGRLCLHLLIPKLVVVLTSQRILCAESEGVCAGMHDGQAVQVELEPPPSSINAGCGRGWSRR